MFLTFSIPFHSTAPSPTQNEGDKKEYRVWNPFRSKLAAAVLGGVDKIHMPPGSKVLYLGAASGTTVSHVSDIVGPEGLVYAVEFSHRSGRDLLNVAKKRTNIIPIIEDARHPHKYRMLVGMVDTVFADVAQPDQARIVALNAHNFLRNGGHFVISIKASCIDSTAVPEAVFAAEVKKLQSESTSRKKRFILDVSLPSLSRRLFLSVSKFLLICKSFQKREKKSASKHFHAGPPTKDSLTIEL